MVRRHNNRRQQRAEEREVVAPPVRQPVAVVVSKKDYKIFGSILKLDGAVRKDIRFEDFVMAMTKVGFTTSEAKGSGVRFTPRGEAADAWGHKPIVIHRPHGQETKLQAWNQDPIKTTLEECYGWGAETFRVERR